MFKNTDFDALKLTLASPEEIRSWSYGEVVKPETINYRTLKPEKDGLFDEKIFGPTRDYECYCGKYKRVRYKGVVCDKCGVEVTQSRVRRERLGHINLASPAVHTWFFRRNPNTLAYLLDIPAQSLEAVIYFASFLTIEIDEEKRQAALEKLAKAYTDKEKELTHETDQRTQELKKELENQISRLQKEKKGEGIEIKIEELKEEYKKQVLFLREKLAANLEEVRSSLERVVSLVRETKVNSVLGETEYAQLEFWEITDFLKVGMGAEVLQQALLKLDLEKELQKLKKQIHGTSQQKRTRAIKRFKIVQGFLEAKINPTWMILQVLPVIPPELRPMVQLPGGRFATSDLNDLYRRVINRNNRLKNLLRLGAPEIILQNEKRMLQEGADALIEGTRRAAGRRRFKKELRSLSEMLRGKQGRFRQNLLGKRVDYSGRSVIVVGPELKMDQVGIPKEMALELFKPFVLHLLIMEGFAPNLKSAKNVLSAQSDEVWDILERVTLNHPVLMVRQPTLHRQNIQAFYPVLIEGSAIKLHPAVCSGYNADFDGDQMGVFVPLSLKARAEAKEEMLSPLNMLKLADGRPLVTIKYEVAIGLYYLTLADEIKPNQSLIRFFDPQNAVSAYQNDQIGLRTPIITNINHQETTTTPGRIIFNKIVPEKLRFVNEPLNLAKLNQLIDNCFNLYGVSQTRAFVDNYKNLGREFCTLFGISFSAFDFEVPAKREEYFLKVQEELNKIESNYKRGLTTPRERHNQITNAWGEVEAKLDEAAMKTLDPNSVVGVIIHSGASKANQDTIRQVNAMQGRRVDSRGEILETPIRTSVIEGSSPFEGFLSLLGGRKGLIDIALLTADAGYLTRRLVDVTHDILIREEDCQTEQFLTIDLGEGLSLNDLKQRLFGRTTAAKLKDQAGEVIFQANELIREEHLAKILSNKITQVSVRSPLTCQTRFGICSLCYGADQATRQKIKLGTAVGVIAAQAIGEPGTQLTLHSKHRFGAAKKEITQGLPRVEELFETRTPKQPALTAELSGEVLIETNEDETSIIIRAVESVPYEYLLTDEAILQVEDGQKIKKGGLLFTSIQEGEVSAPEAGVVQLEKGKLTLLSKIEEERRYSITPTTILKVKSGDYVVAGDPLTEGSLDLEEILKTKGILKAQTYLLQEIQAVYQSQGVTIHNKHFEVIIRKMSEKVQVRDNGDSNFLPGDYVDHLKFAQTNKQLRQEGKRLARGKRALLGISRASLLTDSWLSAASFEETSNVLAGTAVNQRPQIDHLLGLKENVIIGKLIPTGEEKMEEPYAND